MIRENLYAPYSIIEKIRKNEVDFFNVAKKKIALEKWNKVLNSTLTAERPFPILKKIEARKTALIVVDMQKAFLEEGASLEIKEGKNIITNINKIAKKIRQKKGMVIFFRYLVNNKVGLLRYFEKKSYLSKDRESPLNALKKDHKEFQLHPKLDIKKEDLILDKTRYSAVCGSEIVKILRNNKIENVIVTGVTTDVCAGNTAEDLMQFDFNTIMVWDGTAALDRLDHEIYLARIFALYGDVMPTQEVMLRIH